MASPRAPGVINAPRRTVAETGGAKSGRAGARRRFSGGGPAGARPALMRAVVVESPAKARTIGRWLGPSWRVMATRGHVRDLPAKAGSVDPGDGFAMVFEAGKGAARTLGAIARALARADALVLATDPDREGEAIAWQVLDWLEARDALGEKPVHRAVFHEVTEGAVRAALARPRDIDMDLVRAWQARRALDYLVGYGLSPLLWRKLPGCRSAGRVQSVALRLVCEREAEIEAFAPRRYWTVEARAAGGDGAGFAATLARLDGTDVGAGGVAEEAAARAAAGRIREAELRAVAVERDTLRRQPGPPFATATLQLAVFRRLGLGVGETMAIAQRLYEGVELGAETTGLITYPRTDSTAMAGTAVAEARAVIAERFGADCVPARPRTFRTRARNAQEAHEAIRPSDFARTPEAVARHLDRDAAGLYGLIWRRALASQMAAARVERVRIELAGADGAVVLAGECTAMAFDGHYRLRVTQGDGASGDAHGFAAALPQLRAGDRVSVTAVRTVCHPVAPPPRHTEAGLVRRLEERGIGRPSTWAAIVAVLRERGYAVLRERRLAPTERGRVLAAFLEHGFGRWMDYGFTAAMEDRLDRVAAGALARRHMLEDFWEPFDAALGAAGALTGAAVRAAVEARLDAYLFGRDRRGRAIADAQRRRCPTCGKDTLELKLSRHGPFVGCAHWPECGYRRGLSPAAAEHDGYAGPRALGADPHAATPVSVRRGPTGWYVQRDARDGEAKPERVSLPPSLEPDDVDLGTALGLLALPRRVGPHPESGAPILAGIGRYGPWVRHGETYAALPDGEDVLGVGINRAVALLADKEIRNSRARGPNTVLRELGRHPGDGAPVRLKTGHYGPFVAHRRRYASLPADTDPEAVTLEDAVALLAGRDA